jgi:hypothetical protein
MLRNRLVAFLLGISYLATFPSPTSDLANLFLPQPFDCSHEVFHTCNHAFLDAKFDE